MGDQMRRLVACVLVVLLLATMLAVSGCAGDDADDSADSAAVESDAGGDSGEAESDPAADGSGDTDDTALRDGAQDIAQAYFVGPMTDFTADDFDWSVEAMVEDNEGGWWARVQATPHDSSLETEQIYVNLPPGMSLWRPVDYGTGVDPATDDRFPDEVGGQL